MSSQRKEIDDEDSSDGGFKHRISCAQPITRTVKRIESVENNVSDRQLYGRPPTTGNLRPRLDKGYSSLDSDQSIRTEWQMDSPLKRPTQLYFSDNKVCDRRSDPTPNQCLTCQEWRFRLLLLDFQLF